MTTAEQIARYPFAEDADEALRWTLDNKAFEISEQQPRKAKRFYSFLESESLFADLLADFLGFIAEDIDGFGMPESENELTDRINDLCYDFISTL